MFFLCQIAFLGQNKHIAQNGTSFSCELPIINFKFGKFALELPLHLCTLITVGHATCGSVLATP